MPECTIQRVAVGRTLPLRKAVLRPHLPQDDPYLLPDDEEPTTAAYAAVTADEQVLAVGRLSKELPPFDAGDAAGWRIRGMATSRRARNRGLGARILDALIAHVAADGGGIVWCNARLPARGLYERAGLQAWGEVWEEPHIGPHVVMWRTVA